MVGRDTGAQQDIKTAVDKLIELAQRDELFVPDARLSLTESLSTDEDIRRLVSQCPALHEAIADHARTSESWEQQPERWLVLLLVMEGMRTPLAGEATGREAEPEEHEEETDEEDEDADDDGGEQKLMRKAIALLGKEFTYVDQLVLMFNNVIDRSPIAARNYQRSRFAVGKARQGWGKVKDWLRKIADVVGLALRLWHRLMRRSPLIDVPTRIIGTVVILVALAVLYLVMPLWRLVRNPYRRLLRWLGREINLEGLGEEEP